MNESVGDTSPSVDQVLGDTVAGASAQSTVDNVSPTNDANQAKKVTRFGRFEIRDLLGTGAFGRVYKAYDPQLERFVALKLPIFAATDQQRVRRFIAEAKHAARLSHPNIVQVFESGQVGEKSFIAAQFVKGETLAARIGRQQLTAREAAELVVQLADALAYAHQNGTIHRDIKPENIMLDANGRPLIMDFGLAKRLDDNSNMTRDGALLGTPAYMSPEQARGEVELLGPASDQYSLGVVLYRLLSGATPFAGPMHAVIANVAISQAPSLSQCGKFVPKDLAAICDKTLKHSAKERYADCGDLKADLSRWLAGQPISIKSTSRGQNSRGKVTWFGNRSVQIAMGLGGLLLLASIIILFKGNKIEVADDANVSIKLDGENLVMQPITPTTPDTKPSSPSSDAARTADEPPRASDMSTRVTTLGDNLLPPIALPQKWNIYQRPENADQVSITYEEDAVCIDIRQVVGEYYYTHLYSPELEIEEGAKYRFSITARSTNRSGIVYRADIANPDYNGIGLYESVQLPEEYQTYHHTFVASGLGDQKGRIALVLNYDVGKIYISKVELQKCDVDEFAKENSQKSLQASDSTLLSPTQSTDTSTLMAGLGDNILPSITTPKLWHINQNPESRENASISYEGNAVCFDIREVVGKHVHSTQLASPLLELEDGGTYRFSITARSPSRSRIYCCAALPSSDYRIFGLTETVTPTEQFQTFQQTFVANGVGDQKGRIALDFNIDAGKIYISNVELRRCDATAVKTGNSQLLANGLDLGSPAGYFRLEIIGRNVDAHSLKLSAEGLRSVKNQYAWPIFEVNGQSWEPEKQLLLSASAFSGMLPENLNFSAAKIRCVPTGSYVQTNYSVGSDGVEISYVDPPAGAGDCCTIISIPYASTVAEDMLASGVAWNEPWSTNMIPLTSDKKNGKWVPPTHELLATMKVEANFQFEKLDFDFWDGPLIENDHNQATVPKDYFALMGQRTFKCPDGLYSVESFADDGIRVWVDDKLTIDDWNQGLSRHQTQEVRLATGEHVVRFEYFEDDGLSRLFVNVRRVE